MQERIGMANNYPAHTLSGCNAQISWWDPDTFNSFYKDVEHLNQPDINIPDTPFKLEQSVKEKDVFLYKDRTWINTGITIKWTIGPIASETIIGLAEWDHWHTTLKINAAKIHIDYISFFRLGPQTAYREYRVFSNSKEIGRGGGASGYLMGNFIRRHNWPLSLEVDDHLIYIFQPLQSWGGRLEKGIIDEPNSIVVLKENLV
jgi:hypothetical protein